MISLRNIIMLVVAGVIIVIDFLLKTCYNVFMKAFILYSTV